MKIPQYLGVVLCISWIALTGANVSAQEGICAQVACSGHGRCIETADGPACACHAGYVPDGTGLNCIAEAPPAAPPLPVAGTGAPPQVVVTAPGPPVELGQEDYARVKAALPQYSHEEDFMNYGRLRRSGRIQGSFIDYKIYRAGKMKAGGVAMIAVGVVVAANFFPLLGVGIAEGRYEQSWCDEYGYDNFDEECSFQTDDFMLFFGPGLATLLTGTPLIIVGAIRLHRAKNMRKVLRSLAAQSSAETLRLVPAPQSPLSRFFISPFFSAHSSTVGLSGKFVF